MLTARCLPGVGHSILDLAADVSGFKKLSVQWLDKSKWNVTESLKRNRDRWRKLILLMEGSLKGCL